MKREDLVKAMESFLGAAKGNAKHKEIVSIYNSCKPLPRGVKMLTSYAWCAATVSAAIIKAGLAEELPRECSCGKMIELLKQRNMWVESDSYLANPGDLIFYSWEDTGIGECTEGHDHVGMIKERDGNTMLVMEGNKSGKFGYRAIKANSRYIRGFGVFKLSDEIEDKEYRIAVKGDSISKWVKNFGYDKNFIIRENNLKYPYWLTAGKKYRVR